MVIGEVRKTVCIPSADLNPQKGARKVVEEKSGVVYLHQQPLKWDTLTKRVPRLIKRVRKAPGLKHCIKCVHESV